jgi:hypothetical protein
MSAFLVSQSLMLWFGAINFHIIFGIISISLMIILYRCGPVFFLLTLCAIAVDTTVAYLVLDFSADGNSYHDDAITVIANGGDLYADHLDVRLPGTPMFQWIFPAMLRVVGIGEHITSSGKIFASLLLYLNCTLIEKQEDNSLRRGWFSWPAILISFPAIFWSQIFTGYGDYWTYWALALVTVNGIAMLSTKNATIFNENLCYFFLSVALASTIKYQSALICGCAGLVFFVLLYQKTRWVGVVHCLAQNRIILCYAILAILSSVGITLTVNVQLFDHLVPIFSRTDATSVLFDNQFYSQKPRYLHWIFSWFSNVELNTNTPRLNFLQLSSMRELLLMKHPDLRFGAGGPLFLLAITFSLFAIFKVNKRVFLIVLLICLIYSQLPGVGTMRYYPLIQIMPGVTLLFLGSGRLKNILLCIAATNFVLVMVGSTVGYSFDRVSLVLANDFFRLNPGYTERLQDPGYFRKNKLFVVAPARKDAKKCKPIDMVWPSFPRPGQLCQ